MKNVMIIDEETDKLISNYEIADSKVKSEKKELEKTYDDVSVDFTGDIIVWKT